MTPKETRPVRSCKLWWRQREQNIHFFYLISPNPVSEKSQVFIIVRIQHWLPQMSPSILLSWWGGGGTHVWGVVCESGPGPRPKGRRIPLQQTARWKDPQFVLLCFGSDSYPDWRITCVGYHDVARYPCWLRRKWLLCVVCTGFSRKVCQESNPTLYKARNDSVTFRTECLSLSQVQRDK